jgi:hypothetical protein
MSLFLAVIFACVGDKCVFFQSADTFKNERECSIDVTREVRDLEKANPQITKIEGACLEIPFKGA